MSAEQCLTKHHIIVRVGHTEVEPAQNVMAEILKAVEQYNQSTRLPGLEDHLNPTILAPAKVENFLNGLPRLPDETLNKLQNTVLYLNAPTLFLNTATAITPENLEKGYTLTISESTAPGAIVQPTLEAAIDEAKARDLANQGHQATIFFNQEVERLDAALDELDEDDDTLGDVLRELSTAQSKRFNAAIVWRENSAALAAANPEDAALAAEAEQAKEMASLYIAPPSTGMPAP